MGIDYRRDPFGILEVIDHCWLERYNAHEGALCVAYAYAARLYRDDSTQGDEFTIGALYPKQLDWLASGKVRPTVIEPMTRLLKQRAHQAYAAQPEQHQAPSQARNQHRDEPVSKRSSKFPWILNRSNGQLTHRTTGRVFERNQYRRDDSSAIRGYIVNDQVYCWAGDLEIETLS